MTARSVTPPRLEADEFPPFAGFPRDGVGFLKKLKRNNRRPWFEAHKEEFESSVNLPMQSLIVSLRPHFAQFAPEYDLHPKRSLFRIYRDTRFSKDKTPYKTHVAAHMVLRGEAKGLVGSGYYVHVEPGECFVGAGIYMPDGQQLKKIRTAIAQRGDEFRAIVRNAKFRRRFTKVEGDSLVRMPKGFDEDHPMAEWLKLKQFFVGVSLPEQRAYRAAFVTDVADICRDATPLVRFLNGALRG